MRCWWPEKYLHVIHILNAYNFDNSILPNVCGKGMKPSAIRNTKPIFSSLICASIVRIMNSHSLFYWSVPADVTNKPNFDFPNEKLGK